MKRDSLPPELQQVIERAFAGLTRYRDQVVLVGGLAKIFYLLHPDFVPPSIDPRATVDLDLALTRTAMDHRRELHDQLVSHDLVPFVVLGPDGRPIEMQYQRSEDGDSNRADTCVEFIVPFQGDGQRPRPVDGAVLPSALKYVELLLIEPLRLEDPDLGTLLLPHPLSYIAQKTLMRDGRRAEKRPRDQADCVYVAWGFQPQWPGWKTQARVLSGHPGRRRWLSACHRQWSELYQDGNAVGSREVEMVYSQLGGRPLEAAIAARIMSDLARELS